MFEGVIHRVLVGYLGRYVKDFHKHQLKLSLWNEEVLLEDVELVPEALDFLQLPFSLKRGRIGRLSIQISWKNLVWDQSSTVSVVLQDVYLFASPRDVHEWDPDAVEKRELAGKRAKLAAAELEKLSRRVCDNGMGKSFFSFITAKILKSIHVSIRNFHVQYCQPLSISEKVLFGITFSTLTMKQDSFRQFAKEIGGQMSKTVENEGLAFVRFEIEGLWIYCHKCRSSLDIECNCDSLKTKVGDDSWEESKFDPLLQPFNVTMSIGINRVDKILPQYSVRAEFNKLAISLNEVQIQHILILSDYLMTGHLRERYGRYRPWDCPLPSRLQGWQKLWWHYAQQSVLSDVRKKLKKTSWKFLGNRLSYRRKYINLYRRKLDLLQKEQSIDECIHQGLEKMEQECDVDEILGYRSTAECEIKEVLKSAYASKKLKTSDLYPGKQNDDQYSSRSHGWLNWLSRGMLGAGGTGDIGQFAGVVSDEVVKDIYEATDFHPDTFSSSDVDGNDKNPICIIDFKIAVASICIWKQRSSLKIVDLRLLNSTIECKISVDLITSVCFIKSVQLYRHDKVILQVGQILENETGSEFELSYGFHVEVSSNKEQGFVAKATIETIETTCERFLFIDMTEFFDVLRSVKFHHQRVLSSLDGIDDAKTRLSSKYEYVLSNPKKLSWDLQIHHAVVNVPWETELEQFNLVLYMGCLKFTSNNDEKSNASYCKQTTFLKQLTTRKPLSTSLMGFDVQQFFSYFQIDLQEIELKLTFYQCDQMITLMEKFNATLLVGSCMIDDISIPEKIKVCALVPTLRTKLSTLLNEAALALAKILSHLSRLDELKLQNRASGVTIAASIDEVIIHMDLGNGEHLDDTSICLQQLQLEYTNIEFDEWFASFKAAKFMTSSFRSQNDNHVVVSCGVDVTPNCPKDERVVDQCFSIENETGLKDRCFMLHYESRSSSDLGFGRLTVDLSDLELQIHPHIFRLMTRFVEKTFSSFSNSSESELDPVMDEASSDSSISSNLELFEFFSYGNVSSGCFPFMSLNNSELISSLEDSPSYSELPWQKVCKFVENKLGSSRMGKKRSEMQHHSSPRSKNKDSPSLVSSSAVYATSSNLGNILRIDCSICNMKLHFHDYCCVIGTVTVPQSKSSLIIEKNSMNMLCSVDGLTLTSSWSTKGVEEVHLSSSVSNRQPVLKMHIQKTNAGSSHPVAINVVAQHVYCMLPSDYFEIVVGYFSLPDWNLGSRKHEDMPNCEVDRNDINMLFKLEVLESSLVVPVHKEKHEFAKLKLQQICCSFLPNCDPDSALQCIPQEARLPSHKVAQSTNCWNIFGRSLSLCFMSCNCDHLECITHDIDALIERFTFISQLSVDIWVRIPTRSGSNGSQLWEQRCIMTRILDCQLMFDDGKACAGLMALWNVVSQYLDVENDCKRYRGDVLQFNYWKKHSKTAQEILYVDSGQIFTEIKCCVDILSIKFYHWGNEIRASTPVVVANIQLILSASLRNENIVTLDASFPRLIIDSVLQSVIIVQFLPQDSAAFHVYYTQKADGGNELYVAPLKLEIWLDISVWIKLFEIYMLYFDMVLGALKDDGKYSKQGSLVLHVIFGYTCLRMSVPINVIEAGNGGCTEETEEETHNILQTCHNLVEVCADIQCVDLTTIGYKVKTNLTFEKVGVTIGSSKEGRMTTWPFVSITNITMNGESHNENVNVVDIGIQCDDFNLWLSHHVINFWNCARLYPPELPSSHPIKSNVFLKLEIRKASAVISDESWSSSGPLLNVDFRRCIFNASVFENNRVGRILSTITVNYKNIHKVLWEPLLEAWNFQIDIRQKHEVTALRNNFIATEIQLISAEQLNLNFSVSGLECMAKVVDIVRNACNLRRTYGLWENRNILRPQTTESRQERHSSPYKLQNMTSVPLFYHLSRMYSSSGDLKSFESGALKSLQPGSMASIDFDETREELKLSCNRGMGSHMQINVAAHHYMSIQLDGMSYPSIYFSVDHVGKSYLEVDFLKDASKIEAESDMAAIRYKTNIHEQDRSSMIKDFVIPLVVDVSIERYTKIIRLYSTVIVYNTTSTQLQLRFDIPFGVRPKILDPLYPGEGLPVPVLLAEVGQMRCRPFGKSHLWSEVHDLASIISAKPKGFVRPFICYPSYPSSHPFRCCLSVEKVSLPAPFSVNKAVNGPFQSAETRKLFIETGTESFKTSKEAFIYQVMLSTPFMMNNYLPCTTSLTVEGGGVMQTVVLTEVETPFPHVDPAHDLDIEISINGYKPSLLKFPRAESFNENANNCERLSLVGIITIYRENLQSGPNELCLTVEKIIHPCSGARELSLFAPFLLYNCTSLTLSLLECASEMKGCCWTVPPCYEMTDADSLQSEKDGLQLLSSNQVSPTGYEKSVLNCIIAFRKYGSKVSHRQIDDSSVDHETSSNICSSGKSPLIESVIGDVEYQKIKPFIFSPSVCHPVGDVMIRVERFLPEHHSDVAPPSPWSPPFSLVAASGSSTVLIPKGSSSSHGAFVISVTSSTLDGPLSGRSQAIIMHPRYVICNACKKDLVYKQKGTGLLSHLRVGQHSSLNWADTTRELLVSICFDEPGWQWSGGFLPDHLGDTQIKIRNYDGSLKMLRVEVQNAETLLKDEKMFGDLGGYSGTNVILISEDNVGFVPYRIDNLSKEKFRIYQQKCESLDTIVHPYTSCSYAWDEPYYPRRLIVEVPGERLVGLYDLDTQKGATPVKLKSTTEKPERTLLITIYTEGEINVLSIIDSNFHLCNKEKSSSFSSSPVTRKREKITESNETYRNKFSASLHSFGISLIDDSPQELLFASAKDITFDLVQRLDQQKVSFHISSLQIDNQSSSAAYPVLLSFNEDKATDLEIKNDSSESNIEEALGVVSDRIPVLSLAVATLGKQDLSLPSFDYIILRVASFHLELEQELLWSLIGLLKAASSRFRADNPLHSTTISKSGLDSTNVFDDNGLKERQHNRIPWPSNHRPNNKLLPSVVPIGAPWQTLTQNIDGHSKIYVKLLHVAPIVFSLSFSSSPWTNRNTNFTMGTSSLIHRGLLALADVEGARIQLKQLRFANQISSFHSLQNILLRHYTRQLLHEMYKVFGSAAVIGNPIAFARSMGLGIRDFLAVPARNIFQSPSGIVMGMARGTTSLVNNTVYAFSDATTQFTKAAHKGIVALTLNDHPAATSSNHEAAVSTHSKGVVHEVLEGLTGLLQTPVKEVEKHGLPGVLSGIALGVTSLLAKPAASILEVTGKTAQSIRNKSMTHQLGIKRYRARLPRPLNGDLPLKPYSWEEAIGVSILKDTEHNMKFKDESFIICKSLEHPGSYAVVTERLMLVASCSHMVELGKPEFRGVPMDLKWSLELEFCLDSVIHVDALEGVIHVVGSTSEVSVRQSQRQRRTGQASNQPSRLPLSQTQLKLPSQDDADQLVQVMLCAIERGKDKRRDHGYVVHRNALIR